MAERAQKESEWKTGRKGETDGVAVAGCSIGLS